MQTKPTSTVRVRILVYTQASAYLLLLPQIWRGRKEEDMILFSCPITLKMRIILNLPRTPWLKKYHGFLINLGRSFFYSWVGRIMFIQIDEVLPIGNVEKQQQKMNLWRSLIFEIHSHFDARRKQNQKLKLCVRSRDSAVDQKKGEHTICFF